MGTSKSKLPNYHPSLLFQITVARQISITMETIKNAANYVSETVQGSAATASKEGNKEVAKDSNANLSTRAQAAGDALSDKADEQQHNRKADVHNEAAKH